MNIDALSTYIQIGVGGLFLLLLIIFMFSGRKKRTRGDTYSNFPDNIAAVFRALDALYHNDRMGTLAWLKKAARFFPGELNIFLLIGDMIRERRPRKALTLHRGLLHRKGLTDVQRARIHYHIGEDYLSDGEHRKALESFRRSKSLHPEKRILEKMVGLEIRLSSFDDALSDRKALNKKTGQEKKSGMDVIALHAVDRLIRETPDSCRPWIKRYEKQTGDSAGALLLSLRTACANNSGKKAVQLGKKLLKTEPADEVTMRFFLSGNERGRRSSIDIPGPLAHAFDVVFRQTDPAGNRENDPPENTSLYHRLFAARTADPETARLLERNAAAAGVFTCRSCGSTRRDNAVLCPACGSEFRVSLKTLYGG